MILSWLAIAAGLLGLLASGLQVAGMLPAPEIVYATAFIAAAAVFGTGLVPLTVLDSKQPACLYFSWFGIVAGGLGLIRHSVSACGLCLKRLWHYDLFISVGTRDGTPTIALPLEGHDGQRRYRLGTVTLQNPR